MQTLSPSAVARHRLVRLNGETAPLALSNLHPQRRESKNTKRGENEKDEEWEVDFQSFTQFMR